MPERRSLAERLAARAYLGPLGHLWSAVADIAVFTLRSLIARVTRRKAA